MKIVKMETHMLSQKVIANVTPEFARVYNIPEGHTSVGFFSADNDDIGYLAVDDASKKANIKLIHAETYYGGTTCSWIRRQCICIVFRTEGRRCEEWTSICKRLYRESFGTL